MKENSNAMCNRLINHSDDSQIKEAIEKFRRLKEIPTVGQKLFIEEINCNMIITVHFYKPYNFTLKIVILN